MRTSGADPGGTVRFPGGLQPDLPIETVSCLICGRTDGAPLHGSGPLRAVRCRGCGLVFMSPRLAREAREAIYRGDYFASPRARDRGYTDYLGDASCYLKTYELRARPFLRWRDRGRVLDVGCAAGFFLRIMEDRGWEGWGVELSPSMAEHARVELGVSRVRTGTIQDLAKTEGVRESFDLITFWDSIEHLEDPLESLDTARRLLKPGGAIAIETQNVASAFARLMGARWHHFKYEEHLWHFSPATLERLLAKVGLALTGWTRRRSGKYVPFRFIVERSLRMSGALHFVLSRLPFLSGRELYLNPFDEMIAIARKSPSGPSDSRA